MNASQRISKHFDDAYIDRAHADALMDNAAFDVRADDHAEALIENAERDAVSTIWLAADHAEALAENAARADLARCTAMVEVAKADVDPMQASVAAYIDSGEGDDEPIIDYEAIAWAYKKLLAFGVGNGSMDNAMMLDRLNLMLLSAPAA